MLVADESQSRILIVDDNPQIHQDIYEILKSSQASQTLDNVDSIELDNKCTSDSCPIVDVADAFHPEALDMVTKAWEANAAYDLVIVDISTSAEREAVETIEKLWDFDPDLHIIVSTECADQTWQSVTGRLGSSDKLLILQKPFDHCELMQAVRALSEKRRAQSQARASVDSLQHLVADRSRELESLHLESASLLDALAAGLIAYDAFGFITRWNGAAEKLFGVPAQHALNKLVMELELPWQDPQLFAEFFQTNQYLKNKRIELILNPKADEPSTVEVSLHPVTLNGLPVGGLMLIDDVTSRRQLEVQLNQAQKLEAVGQLAAGIAHEINTPMQYVGDNVQFLRATIGKFEPTLRLIQELAGSEFTDNTTVLDKIRTSIGNLKVNRILDQLPKAIQDVEQGIENVVRIVQAMKELSHPGAETAAAFDIHRVLESAIVVSRSEWKHIAVVETDFVPNPPGLVGFANKLQQVFLNLLVNATHAIEARHKGDCQVSGRIRVSTAIMNDRFLISIQDNGCGIPDKIRNRVYDPFFTTKAVGKGTGQGLAIAHQIVATNHHGQLWFESEVDKGTTFYIELPIATDCVI